MGATRAENAKINLEGNTADYEQVKAEWESSTKEYPNGSTFWDFEALVIHTWHAGERKWY